MSIKYEHGRIDHDESGNGPSIVLVPGSCATGAAWRPVVSHLNDDFRCVTTSLLGYGGTTERRTVLDTDISLEAELVEAVVREASGPAHLVGHSFGGLTALAVALRNRVPLLSLTIIEAPAAGLLLCMGEHGHFRAFRDMTDQYFAAYRAGDRAAIRSMIDFYGGAGTFAAWPQRVRAYAIETTPVNLVDWKTAYDFQPSEAELAKIDIPTVVSWGETSHASVRRANQLLAASVRNAVVFEVAAAAHFMIMTHARTMADAIARHVRQVEARTREASAFA